MSGVLKVCNDPGRCFAKVNGKCIILKYTYPEGVECPFRKEKKEGRKNGVSKRKKTRGKV